jgi:hypothetical protein
MFSSNKDDKTITFKTYTNMFEAELDKEILDDAGIEHFFSDENISSALPIDGSDLGRIRLHIFEKDLATATELINSEDDNIILDNEMQKEEE